MNFDNFLSRWHHADSSASLGRIDCYRRGTVVLKAKKIKADAASRGFDE